MKRQIVFLSGLRWFALIASLLIIPVSAFSTTTLTGAVQFATDPNGNGNNCLIWNTYPDNYGDLWLALHSDGSSPLNGPTDAESPLSIPLKAGVSYKFYIFAHPGSCSSAYNGLNLFFDGNNSVPGISVFGPINTTTFQPNASNTYTLQIAGVTGSGRNFYRSGGVIVLLDGYNWNTPANPPGNVCRTNPEAFVPGSDGANDYFGYFEMHVFVAGGLGVNQSSGAPGTKLTISGTGFAPSETVTISFDTIAANVIGKAVTDASGSFTTVVDEPQRPYESVLNLFAFGNTSAILGATTVNVTSALTMSPKILNAGDTTKVHGEGFGSMENVSIYLDEPRELLATAVTDKKGSFTGANAVNVVIPANTASGLNGIVGIGQNTAAIGLGKIRIK